MPISSVATTQRGRVGDSDEVGPHDEPGWPRSVVVATRVLAVILVFVVAATYCHALGGAPSESVWDTTLILVRHRLGPLASLAETWVMSRHP